MSGQIVRLEPDPHVAVQTLLPWYLTGRLEAVERAQVDAHLADCSECRAELEAERQWQLMQPGAGPRADVDEGWAKMRAMLGDEGRTASPPAALPSAALAGEGAAAVPRRRQRRAVGGWPFGVRPVSRAWAAPALLSAALLVAIGVSLRGTPAPPDAYRALAAPAEDGATAVVRFRPDATEAQIRRSLNESGARLVDGPTVTDAYVVRLPRERYAASLDKLRHQPAVALVEALEGAAPR